MGNGVQTMIIAFGMLFVLTNAFLLGLKVPIGEVLAHFFKHWKFATLVLLVNFVVLPACIIGFASLVNIPDEIKIGYCIVALAAGAPFAPLLTRLAKGDMAMSTMLFVALIVGTVIAVPLALSPAVTALVPSAKHIAIWDIAWPLWLFLIGPLILGILTRLRYPEFIVHITRPLTIIELVCLLLYINVFITANLHLFGKAWGSGAYLAALAVPALGILFGSIISIFSQQAVGARHASVITTAQRSVSGAIIVTIFNYTQPLANVSITIINTAGIFILLILSLEWGRAYRKLAGPKPRSRPAPA